jgi:hypothetical protein
MLRYLISVLLLFCGFQYIIGQHFYRTWFDNGGQNKYSVNLLALKNKLRFLIPITITNELKRLQPVYASFCKYLPSPHTGTGYYHFESCSLKCLTYD